MESVGGRIYHLALRREWDAAVVDGSYRRSTIDQSLDEVGFIHASFAEQVQGTADRFYRGHEDVVLLTIDTAGVRGVIKVEDGFPHIYGPLPVTAVVRVDPVSVASDGRLMVAPLLAD